MLLGDSIQGTMYTTTIAWTPIMEKSTGMKIRVIPEDSDAIRFRMVQHGEALTTSEGLSAVGLAIEGIRGFVTRDGGPFQIRVVWNRGYGTLGFMVRGDSKIRTTNDIKPGLKWASIPAMPPIQAAYKGFFAWCGVDVKDMVEVPHSNWPAATKALAEGKVDIAYTPTSAPFAFETAANPHGVRFLELNPNKDPEAAKRYQTIKPAIGFAPCEKGVKAAEGIWTMSVFSAYVTRAESDPELIYQITKWLGDNWDLYKDKHPRLVRFNPKGWRIALDNMYIPVHEGTIRYLKEKGIWTSADDARQKFNIQLLTKYVKAYRLAIVEADKKKVKVTPANKEWLNLWGRYKKDIPRFRVPVK